MKGQLLSPIYRLMSWVVDHLVAAGLHKNQLGTEKIVVSPIMENPKRYGFNLPPEQMYTPMWCDTVEVSLRRRLKLSDLCRALDTDFKVLKELNPQIRGYYLPRGHHTIKVPPGFGSKLALALQKLGSGSLRKSEKIFDGYYVVRKGDTLGRIAQRTGVSIATLRSLNEIQGSIIWAGQKLRLPPNKRGFSL